MADKSTKAGFGGPIDPEKTGVYNPPMNPDDPSTMQELKVLTPEEEAVLAKAKRSTGRTILIALAAIAAVVTIIMLALANMPDKDAIRAVTLPPKAPVPTVDKVAEAPTTDDRIVTRTVTKVALVSATDLAPCKTFTTTLLSNGNRRIVGTDCGGSAATEAPAKAEAPAAPAAAPEATASATPATEPELTEAQEKTAAVIAEVTEDVLEEMHGVDDEPEGAIETSDIESAIVAPSAE